MEPKYAGLALHLLTVVLLAVIAFELANPAKAPVYAPSNSTDYTSDLKSIESDLYKANGYLQDICKGVAPKSGIGGYPSYCNY